MLHSQLHLDLPAMLLYKNDDACPRVMSVSMLTSPMQCSDPKPQDFDGTTI